MTEFMKLIKELKINCNNIYDANYYVNFYHAIIYVPEMFIKH